MILGHIKQWNFLKKSVETGKIPQALLFFGEEKLGKKTIALEFIKLINCQSDDFLSRPCQTCQACQEIQKKIYPDLIFIEPNHSPAFSGGARATIQISQIRDLSWRLSLHPYSASFKTAIIDQAHCMNQEAQTALLKTLEEPKGKALIILITEFPEMLFPTILSRVQKVKFYPIKTIEIENYLKEKKIPDKKIREITKFSQGRPGKVIDFLSDFKKLEEYEQKITDLIKILNSDLSFRFQYIKTLSKNQNLKEVLSLWLFYFRDILLSKINSDSNLPQSVRQYSFLKLRNILQLIQNTNFLISTTNLNPRLALEILMLEL